MKLGFSEPKIPTESEIEELFEEVISYILSQDSGQNALKERFVHGLSDRINADKVLEDLIDEIS